MRMMHKMQIVIKKQPRQGALLDNDAAAIFRFMPAMFGKGPKRDQGQGRPAHTNDIDPYGNTHRPEQQENRNASGNMMRPCTPHIGLAAQDRTTFARKKAGDRQPRTTYQTAKKRIVDTQQPSQRTRQPVELPACPVIAFRVFERVSQAGIFMVFQMQRTLPPIGIGQRQRQIGQRLVQMRIAERMTMQTFMGKRGLKRTHHGHHQNGGCWRDRP